MKFSWNPNISVHRCLNPISIPPFSFAPPFQGYVKPQVRINKMMSITTFVLHDQPQGYMFSYFYKLLRALSLSRILNKFLSNLYIQPWLGKNFKFMVLIFLENALNLGIFTHAPIKVEGNYSFSPCSIFSKIYFRQQQNGWRKPWFALSKFNRKIWSWLGTLRYLYFVWFILFQMWWVYSFVNNISIIQYGINFIVSPLQPQ